MEQPEGEAEQNTYGRLKSCTTLPGVSHSLSGTAPPFLVRQESGGYPVRTVCYDPLADCPDSPSPSPTLTSRRMVEPLALRAPALRCPSLTLLTHPRHAHTRQTRRSALKRKRKNGKEETASGGDFVFCIYIYWIIGSRVRGQPQLE